MTIAKINKHAYFALFSALLMAVLYFSLQLFYPMGRPGPLSCQVEVKVTRGMGFRQAALLLRDSGLLRDPYPIIAIARLTGLQWRLKPGYYSFSLPVTPWEVYGKLRRGEIITHKVRVLEGDCLMDIEAKLVAAGLVKPEEFRALAADREFLRELDVDGPSLEGYLFPDTYSIYKGAPPREVIGIMAVRMMQAFNDDMMGRARELGMSVNEVLTLASIIEKESAVDEERPFVSAVYHNRLSKRMRLQADPTAIYGVKSQREGVTRRDLKRKTKYNTYFIKGLPPGPIASPGLESIMAALYPADVPFLYFVADGTGTHTFSVTHREHEKAVRKYRETRRRNRI